jgi:hypothetical protein
MNREEVLKIVGRALFNREAKEVEFCREHNLSIRDISEEFHQVWEYVKENLK